MNFQKFNFVFRQSILFRPSFFVSITKSHKTKFVENMKSHINLLQTEQGKNAFTSQYQLLISALFIEEKAKVEIQMFLNAEQTSRDFRLTCLARE